MDKYYCFSVDPVSELYNSNLKAGTYEVKILDVDCYELDNNVHRSSRASRVATILLGFDTEGCGFYSEQAWHRIPIERRSKNNHFIFEEAPNGKIEVKTIFEKLGLDVNIHVPESIVGQKLILNCHADGSLSWLESKNQNTKPETGEATMKTQMKALATMMMADENLVNTVKVVFQDNAMDFENNGVGIYKENSKRYTYKAATEMKIEEGDLVVVDVSSHDKQSLKVVRVVQVDEGVDIEMERNYKWVLGKIDLTSFNKMTQLEKQVEIQLEEKKKKAALRQAKEALLGEIGADSLTALIGHDQKES